VGFPFFMRPFLDLMAGATKGELLVGTLLLQAVLLALVGAFGTSGRERDTTSGYLSSGFDTATQTENAANAGFSLTGGLLGLIDFRWTLRLTQRINHHYRTQLFERIQSLPMTSFDDERIGDAIFRVMYDTPSITEVVYRILLTPVGAPLAILLTVSIMGEVYGWGSPIVWAGLSFILVASLPTLPFTAALRRRGGRSRKAGALTTSTVEEGISNILAVQSLGGEGRERSRFDTDSSQSFRQFRLLALVVMLTVLAAGSLGVLIAAKYFFVYTGDEVIHDRLTPGDFSVLLVYFFTIATASVDIGAVWVRIQESSAGLNRVFFLMDLPGEQDPPGASPLPRIRETVCVEDVSFDYDEDSPALRHASFEARVGQITAFVGPAGAGKTTLAYLIPRFVQPQSGRVTIDGVDIAGVTMESLRSQVAFVFQETVLFDATLEENIRFARPEASEAEVRRATRVAGADEFIRRLPQGYATPLGRAGGKLSVGQKQRLSIARALVRDAPILILDEPTSALDSETEQQLVASLREASRDHIVIVIAHRLSTIRSADQILFIEEGRSIERGTHAELMQQPNGAYRHFVELQTRGVA
jgi:ABC-type multidrug transport system fused ATPase/permease subunit